MPKGSSNCETVVWRHISRRDFLLGAAGLAALAAGPLSDAPGAEVAEGVLKFIRACARPDGSYSPSPDPDYKGNSDTASSDLAAVTYAAVLAKTMAWELPETGKSIAFIRRHQQADGRFVNLAGAMDPKDDLAILYNTTQGVVALRALGTHPDVDPAPVMNRFFENERFRKLPWYTTSFFPLFYAAMEKVFPPEYSKALGDYLTTHQAEDGYIQDHVAATFHMAHFFRLIGKPVPRVRQMVQRTLRDQKPDGGWDIKQPDWDVHACFDAMFILRQLGGDTPECQGSIDRGAGWALRCHNSEGGFGHFAHRHSDMDAVYFNFGALLQAGKIPGMKTDLPDAQTLGWGHAMQPGKVY